MPGSSWALHRGPETGCAAEPAEGPCLRKPLLQAHTWAHGHLCSLGLATSLTPPAADHLLEGSQPGFDLSQSPRVDGEGAVGGCRVVLTDERVGYSMVCRQYHDPDFWGLLTCSPVCN